MAQISLSVSTKYDSEIVVSPWSDGTQILSVQLFTNLEPTAGMECAYARDWVTIHGDVEDLRVFAERLLAALPAPIPATAEVL